MPRIFDFISPGVEITEIDESQVTRPAGDDGVLLIGPARTGPGMQPIKVKTIEDFTAVFGKPQSGVGVQDADVWRDGNQSVPTYASYAAQAWLASNTSPVTFVRLLGSDSPEQDSGYTKAGWNLGGHVQSTTANVNRLAYGLWVAPSGAYNATNVTGTLAAILYTTGAVMTLSGNIMRVSASTHAGNTTSSAGTFITSISTANQPATFRLDIWDSVHGGASYGNGNPLESHVFHFDPDQRDGYIRNVLNTNPQKLNSTNYPSTEVKKYFLGETFEESVKHYVTTPKPVVGEQWAFIAPLVSGSVSWIDRQSEAKPSKSGWVISRNPSPTENHGAFTASAQTKLFRVTSLHDGEWFQNNHYITIENLRLGTVKDPNSTFSLVVRSKAGKALETYTNLNLSKPSSNFIGKRIGTQYQSWDSQNDKYDLYGDYENVSSYVRIELADALKSVGGLSDSYAIPWGFFGPAKLKGFTWLSKRDNGTAPATAASVTGIHNLGAIATGSTVVATQHAHHFVGSCSGSGLAMGWQHLAQQGAGGYLSSSVPDHTASFVYPKLRMSDQNTNASKNWLKTDMFGLHHKVPSKNSKEAYNDNSYVDLLRHMGAQLDVHESNNTSTEPSFVFTLDEVHKLDGKFYWLSGSFAAGNGAVVSGSPVSETAASGSQSLLDDKVKQFALPLFGGFDGLDVEQVDPFSNVNILDVANSRTAHYANYSVGKALDAVSDKEVVKYDVISAPGLTNTQLTDDLIEIVEKRGDALAILDLNDGYKETYENSGTRLTTGGTVASVLSTMTSRTELDTSYDAAYFPRIRLRDTLNANGDVLVAPASVGAIGALAFSDANSDGPWFAPAGFNRGGLSRLGGNQGPACVGTWKNLSKSDRDDLYEVNINPIARFPAVGEIVIFGQKTLQVEASALDRVNVRRLLVYLKKKISKVADSILFDPNEQTTWTKFSTKADLILRDVQGRFGIEEYKIVLDDSTTTDAEKDQNIMNAKIFIKPTKSIEFIAIDFIVTRSGIEF